LQLLKELVDTLAKKEDLVAADDHEFMDLCIERADREIRDCMYQFVDKMLAMASEQEGH